MRSNPQIYINQFKGGGLPGICGCGGNEWIHAADRSYVERLGGTDYFLH